MGLRNVEGFHLSFRVYDAHADLHYIDGGPNTVQYLLAVDTINFCFWPQPGLEYEHLARGFKVACPCLLLLACLALPLETDQHLLKLSALHRLALCQPVLCRQCWSDLAVYRWRFELMQCLLKQSMMQVPYPGRGCSA